MQKLTLFLCLITLSLLVKSQTVLEADGPGNTYELINSVLAPGYTAVENPECVHPEFGRHIAEIWDNDLQKYVFVFYIHVTPDNDRCINFDRQRVEIKTYEPSPENLKGKLGETVVYKWQFKLPDGFQPSASFTHIHQVKAVNGDDDDPVFVLTARKGNPDKLELNYYESSDQAQVKLTSADLSLFKGKWVEATERIKIDSTDGSYSINIQDSQTGNIIMSYSNSKLRTIRPDNDFIRPKWGIYRSLLNSSDLRDEAVRFSYFSIAEEISTDVNTNTYSNSENFNINQNFTNKEIIINYELSENNIINLSCKNLNGQTVRKFINYEHQQNGNHKFIIKNCGLPPGIYILILQTDYKTYSKKIYI
ncbi:MAG: heparin lyase I family protein [Paludibacter sp.]|nr:heparin lyase I family protein [Paludibacter sp.]